MSKTTTDKKYLDYYSRKELLISQMQNLQSIMQKTPSIDINNWCVQIEEYTALGQKTIRNMLNNWIQTGKLKAHIENDFLVSDELIDEIKHKYKFINEKIPR